MKRVLPLVLLAGLLLVSMPAPGGAQPAASATTLVADAFGVSSDVDLAGDPLAQVDPTPVVRVFMPPPAETATADVADLGPVPVTGGNVTVESVQAGGSLAEGRATAVARTGNVSLLSQPVLGGLITADVVVAQANARCPDAGTLAQASAGTMFTGLRIAGTPIPLNPAPNTVITIPNVARVVVNEVIPDSRNIGFTVRGLHVFTLDPISGAATGDLIVAEAHANVVCGGSGPGGPGGSDGSPGSPGTPGGPGGPDAEDLDDRDLIIEKARSETATAVLPGGTVGYEIFVTNQSTMTCNLLEVIDRLPAGFTYVAGSARGGLADAVVTTDGNDVVFDLVGGRDVAPGALFTGGFDARVDPGIDAGTFFDDAEVRSTCSTARTGPTAPVVIGEEDICRIEDVGDPAVPDVERIRGQGRIETAIRISQCLFPDGADNVVLGRADVYADSLSGGPLSAERRAPLLYSETAALNPATAAEIERLGATRAVLLGGVHALAPAVEDAVEAAELEVERLGGANRFGTSALVAEALGSTSGQAFITEGGAATPDRGWPDAVSAAPFAGFVGDPILLVTNVSLPNETRDALEDRAIQRTLVIGGEAAVGPAVFGELGQRGHSPRRIAGDNRYATSAAVYDEGVAAGMNPQVLYLATGLDWPDALAVGPMAAAMGQSFLLVDGSSLDASPATRDVIARQADLIGLVRIVGGPATISNEVEAAVRALVGAPAAS